VRLPGLILLLAPLLAPGADFPVLRPAVPDRPPLILQASGALDRRAVPECSALLASRRHPGLFWTLSDSGGPARLVPVRATGLIAPGAAGAGYLGTEVAGVRNLDWEALAEDAAGNLVIGDVGNNLSRRRELNLLIVPEPVPGAATVTPLRHVAFSWPDQREFPDPELRHDCEAIFLHRGRLHLLTKHRRDTLTTVWRAELPPSGNRAFLTQVGTVEVRGMVTDASVSPDGRWLAVLTYRLIWLFDLRGNPENPLSGPAHARLLQPPAAQWQLEGCAWVDDRTLLLGSEEGALFRVPVAEILAGR
jgi:hypothetical protein